MDWLELGQRVEGLRTYVAEMANDEEEYPDTLSCIDRLLADMMDVIDEPLEER